MDLPDNPHLCSFYKKNTKLMDLLNTPIKDLTKDDKEYLN